MKLEGFFVNVCYGLFSQSGSLFLDLVSFRLLCLSLPLKPIHKGVRDGEDINLQWLKK